MTIPDDVAGLARSNPVLGRLSDAARQDLLDGGVEISLGAGQDLVRQGEASDAAYLILAGEIDIQADTAYGSVQLARIGPPALIGEIGALAEVPRTASVRTASPVRALKLDRARLLRAGEAGPALLLSVISGLGRQVANFNSAIGFYTNALSALE